jgi:sortase A
VKSIERLLLTVGVLLLAIFFAEQIESAVLSRVELRHFRKAIADQSLQRASGTSAGNRSGSDFSLWSEQRIAAYEDSLTQHLALPLALLRISKVQLEVPVLDGTGEWVLNRGVGHIDGTVLPGKDGNIGIAGHRDGFFRALKDVGLGDAIELETKDRTDTYRVTKIVIVNPDDVSVLRSGSVPKLTLVTCYPFYFFGSAPQRYIVQASLTNVLPQTSSGFEIGDREQPSKGLAHFEPASHNSGSR